MLGGGYAPLLMSGGRMKNNGSDDNLLWVDWKGESFPAGLDEGLLSLCTPILVYKKNPYKKKKQ
jgi:hypothetical protein